MNKIKIQDLYQDENISEDRVQPVIINEYLGAPVAPSNEYILDLLRLFDFYINTGTATGADKRYYLPERYSYFAGFSEAMSITEDSDYEDFDEAIDNLVPEIGTGITLGSLWINHEELGNQISTMVDKFVHGSASYFTLQEIYNGGESCTDFLEKKTTLLSHYTHFFVEDGLLHCNVSLHDVDIHDIILHFNLRYLLSYFILTSEKFKNIRFGDINIFINNYMVKEEKQKRPVLSKYEIFTGLDRMYPEVYISGDKVSIYEDFIKHLKSFGEI